MSELDVFEVRFAAAYRRYLDEAPTEVDAAAVARAVTTGAQRARIPRWPSSLRLAPALAWLVLLLALLLAALGATLYVGSHRSVLGFSCPAGTDPSRPGPAAQVRPPITYAGPSMAFDTRAGRVVTHVGVQTWTFDVCTRTWTRMYPREPFESDGRLVYDAGSDRTVMVAGMNVWAYDLSTNSWTKKGMVPASLSSQPRVVYDSRSGLVIAQSGVANPGDPWELWSYDLGRDTWTLLPQSGGPAVPPDHALQELVYDPAVDRLVSYDAGSRETWLFDLVTRRWSKSRATTPAINFGYGNSGGEASYDESLQRMIIISRGRVIAYAAAADRWDVLVQGWDPDRSRGLDFLAYGPRSSDRFLASTAYDPVNHRIVVYGGSYPSAELDNEGLAVWVQTDDVLAFDTATREWTTLVEAGTVQRPS